VFFLLAYAPLLLIFVLFGDTYLKLLLYGLYCSLLFFFRSHTDNKRRFEYGLTYLLWLAFILFTTISGFFSHNLPQTLEAQVGLYFAFLIFFFFYRLKPNVLASHLLFKFHIAVAVSLSMISLIFLMIPELGAALPNKNLLFSNFGHSHLSAFLLLIFPYSWWLFLKSQKDKYLLFIPVLFTFLIVFSKGRIALLLAMIELMIVAVSFHLNNDAQKQILHKFAIGFGLSILAFAIVGMGIYSNFSWIPFQVKCPERKYLQYFCKPVHVEPRPLYWKQAVGGLKENILFGFGLGTFGNISQKYAQLPGFTAGNAHNVVLQYFAETGLIAGFSFVALFSWLFVCAARVSIDKLRSGVRDHFFILVGLVAVCINGFLDYDWQISGTFISLVIFLAILMRDGNEQVDAAHVITPKLRKLQSTSFLVLTGAIVLTTILYLSTELTLFMGKTNLVMKIFPFFASQKLILIEESCKENVNSDLLISLYKDDHRYYERLSSVCSHPFSLGEKGKWFDLDPWYNFFNRSTERGDSAEEIAMAQDEVNFQTKLILEARKNVKIYENYELDHWVALKHMKLADHYFSERDLDLVTNSILQAAKLDPWVFNDHSPQWLKTEITWREACLLSESVLELDIIPFGDSRQGYADLAKQCVSGCSNDETCLHSVQKIKNKAKDFVTN